MINSILKSKWNDSKNSFDADLSGVDTYGVHSYYDYNHYLFLRRELDVTQENWANAKKDGVIRHCKLYRGKFLDYIVHKEFKTIEEWVADAGGKMEDVLYGENRVQNGGVWTYDRATYQHKKVPYKPKYVELSVLLKALGYVEPPKIEIPVADSYEEKVRKLTSMLEVEMGMRGLGIGRVYVLDEANQLVPWTNFVGH